MLKCILLILFIIIVCCIVIAASNRRQVNSIISGMSIGGYMGGMSIGGYTGGQVGGASIGGQVDSYTGGQVNGASMSSTSNKHAIIEPNTTIVIDGHNMIHQLQNDKSFSENITYLSEIISNALHQYDVHFVIKNPNDTILKQQIKSKQTKAQMLKEYFEQLVTIGKQFPTITYHLAQGNEPKTNRNHYLKGRDDFLSIYLAKDQYVVSQDRYKDFSSFNNIKPFYHLSTKAGVKFKKTKIDPKAYFTQINKPNLGSHLTYQFVTKDEATVLKVKSGDIIVEKQGSLTKLYLVKN